MQPRRAVIAVSVAVLVLVVAGGIAVSASSAAPRTDATAVEMVSFEAAIAERINEVRRARGLHSLRMSRRLAAAADFHSRDMGQRGYFAHASADGTPFWQRVRRWYAARGFRDWTVGENLIWGTDRYGAAFAVRRWMASSPHRRNILTRAWREIGVGAVFFANAPGEYGGRAVTIVTADFGARS
jgi:uncharacterized protein YkwD